MNRILCSLISLLISFSSFATIGPILGVTTICTSSGVYLSDTTAGGTWSSGTPSIAWVGSSSGILFGASSGTATITYTTGSGFVTTIVTVNPAPASITGMTSACVGSTSTLSDATPGGTWSSSSTAVATVNPTTGDVTGISAGYITISYTVGSCYAAVSFTVSGGSIGSLGVLGCNTVGVGDTMPFGGLGPGVGYLTSDPSIVKYSTYPRAGIVGIAPGVADISIFSYSGCLLGSVPVTVTPTQLVYPITGRNEVCAGDTAQMNDMISGGVWSCSPASAATISATGLLYAISSYPEWVTYTVAGGLHCTSQVDLISLPDPISGPSGVCVGDTIYLSSDVSYGWSDVMLGGQFRSSDTSIAKFVWASNESGKLKGLSPGIDTVTFTDVRGPHCSVSKIITVVASPSVGAITGASTLCIGTPLVLSDSTLSGIWSSSNTSVATIGSSGIVSGVGTGITNITYSATFSCGVATATKTITINALPLAGIITGPGLLCELSVVAFSDSATGGTWSSSDAAVAVVNDTGIVTAISDGIDTVKYTVSNSCGVAMATLVVTVNPLPDAGVITGAGEVCELATILLSDISVGGEWASGMAGVATVASSGTVTGLSAGTVEISYSVSNLCGTAVTATIVTVNPLPVAGTIAGSLSLCVLSAITLSDPVVGGIWNSNDPGIATAGSGGLITGVSAGTDTIAYSVTNVCGTAVATVVVTVNPLPVSGIITGDSVVCVSSSVVLSDLTPGGEWTSGDPALAIAGSSGAVTGLSSGIDTIKYVVTNVCGTSAAIHVLTVNPLPDAGVIAGAGEVCAGSDLTLSDMSGGGTWLSSAMGIATIGTSGVVTGVAAGTAVISYAVSTFCGTAVTAITVTVNPMPDAGSITGSDSLCVFDTMSLAETISGGAWSASNFSAFVLGSGVVLGVTPGADTIFYTIANSCGTANAEKVIHVFDCLTTGAGNTLVPEKEINIYPNPAQNSITITSSSKLGNLSITDLLGQTVYMTQCYERDLWVDLSPFSPGIYFVRSGGAAVKKFIKE